MPFEAIPAESRRVEIVAGVRGGEGGGGFKAAPAATGTGAVGAACIVR